MSQLTYAPESQTSSESGSTTTTPKPERSNTGRKWRNRVIVLLMIVAAVFAANKAINVQGARAAKLNLGDVTLTSQAIPVQTSLPGLVTVVEVKAGDHVSKGERLAGIQVTTTNAQGKSVTTSRPVLSPANGVVVSDPLPVGSTVLPGNPFVELYDPTKMTLVTDVPLADLPDIGPGMTATLSADGLSEDVDAVVVRAVPRVGAGQSGVAPDHLEIVLSPKNPKQVESLIPGLRFTGSLDTDSAKPGSKRVVFVS